MSFTMDASRATANNRRLQRKRNKGFKSTGLPTAPTTGVKRKPVSPIVAQQFRSEMARTRWQQQTTQIVAILVIAAAAIACLVMVNSWL